MCHDGTVIRGDGGAQHREPGEELLNSRRLAPQPRVLRLSVTDRCNFRCLYCMPPQGVPKAAHAELLSLEMLGTIAERLCGYLGIQRIKITGGEPLVRRGIEHLISQLAQSDPSRELSMTSNASLLAGKARILKDAGLTRVNISLDSLDPARFSRLTRGGCLADTMRGIDAARAAGLTPLKINMVLQRSTWREEVPALLDFGAANHLEIRFIELMRTGTERAWCDSEFVAVHEVRSWLAGRGYICEFGSSGADPARRTLVYWRGRTVEVGWIAPRSLPFCASCDRLRLDARGFLRRCLMHVSKLDVRQLGDFQPGQELADTLRAYLQGKSAPHSMDSAAPMNLIGG
jgi:cyclic pyranopterin phosphate synthase